MSQSSHIPVDHRLRPLYRFLAALCGVYMLVFGIIGASDTSGKSAFSRQAADHAWALGLRTNFGFAVISIIAGILVLITTVIGHNVDRQINIWGGVVSLVVGMLSLGVMQTTANYLAFSMANVIAMFIIGIVLFAAGMYGKTAGRRPRLAPPTPVEHPAPVAASAGH